MKNILLPTDLSVQSLWPIHDVMKNAKGQKVSIHVVHVLCPPSSILDLFSIRENLPYRSLPENFTEAFQVLRNKYKANIEQMKFEFIYCNSSRYLNNFIEGNNISEVYMLSKYKYAQPLTESQNCLSYFNKCKVPVNLSPLHPEAFSEYQILSALFNNTDQYQLNTAAEPALSYS